MTETSPSLLNMLRESPDGQSWERLVDLYTPLILGWLRRHGMRDADADDVVQETLTIVFRKLPDFERQPQTGAFRSWLRRITVNCLRDYWKSRKSRREAAASTQVDEMLDQLADPNSGLSQIWNDEHDRHVMHHLLAKIQPQFTPQTWTAFERVAREGANAQEVAEELGITINAVFIAKSRVMSRLRQEGFGLVDA